MLLAKPTNDLCTCHEAYQAHVGKIGTIVARATTQYLDTTACINPEKLDGQERPQGMISHLMTSWRNSARWDAESKVVSIS